VREDYKCHHEVKERFLADVMDFGIKSAAERNEYLDSLDEEEAVETEVCLSSVH